MINDGLKRFTHHSRIRRSPSVIEDHRMFRIPLMKPFVNQQVKDKVCAVLDSGHLTEGPMTRSLEIAFQKYVGCRHALAVTSCTTGLEMALRCLDVKSGDEVIVPDFTYPATADAVAIVGATAVLVDVDPNTFLIDFNALEAAITPRTKAIMPVSEFGNPLDYACLDRIRNQYGLPIIEDAACAIGSSYRGVKTGTLADITVFSLHPRKFITTGEGGIITTNEPHWAAWMDAYKHFGIVGKDADGKPAFCRIGTNYKLSDLQSAVGVVQMEHVHDLLRHRQDLARRYVDLLCDDSRIESPKITEGGESSWQSFCIKVDSRDTVMNAVRGQGIEVQFGAFALHLQPAFRPGSHCRWSGTLAGSKRAFEQALVLPLHHALVPEDQVDVATAVRSALTQNAPRGVQSCAG
jgi:perosamine synthetase